VSVQVVDPESGTHVWAEHYDRDVGSGLFTIQDELTSRIAATVADGGGVLVRTRLAALKPRPLESLTAAELTIRFQEYGEQLSPDLHARFRTAFERAVETEPLNVFAWGALAVLYAHEVILGFNPLPDATDRQRRAAERAIELGPDAQVSWVAAGFAAFLRRDMAALQLAADHVVAINPLNTRSVATMGILLAFAGDIARGMELFDHSTAANPRYLRWYRIVPFLHDLGRGDMEAALRQVKAINLPGFLWGHLALVTAAGGLGRAAEAQAALEGLAQHYPSLRDRTCAREQWALVVWEPAIVDRLMEGFDKAVALAGAHDSP
jgi:hypothetical protein